MNTKDLYTLFTKHPYVSTDTRDIQKGSIFFALKGERFNGNEFAQEALNEGAAYAVVDEAKHATGEKTILVDDVLTALQDLATYHRSQLDIPVIAVAGSNGKTTTKELIKAVLEEKYEAFATKGNFNNHIGVPLTILSIRPHIEIAIIEMGANHEKEIERLCEIADPTHGIITNIGMDHLEGFGSIEGVARANSELFKYLMDNDGIAFVNSTDDNLMRMAGRLENVYTYPAKDDYYHCKLYKADFYVEIRTEDDEIFSTRLIGEYNFLNVAAALCMAKFFGVESSEAIAAIEAYQPKNNRSQIVKKNGNTVILDAYNANPSSVEVAIEGLAAMSAQNKLVIIGDMFELGDYSKDEHERIVQLALEKDFTHCVFCGEAFSKVSAKSEKLVLLSDKEALHKWLNANKPKDTHILVKGSRGMEMETVLEHL